MQTPTAYFLIFGRKGVLDLQNIKLFRKVMSIDHWVIAGAHGSQANLDQPIEKVVPTPYTPSVEELTTSEQSMTPHLVFPDIYNPAIFNISKPRLRKDGVFYFAEILQAGPHQKSKGGL